MEELRIPKSIGRNFRPLSDRIYYHAYEWKYILLFVAYPLLQGILPEKYEASEISLTMALPNYLLFLKIFEPFGQARRGNPYFE